MPHEAAVAELRANTGAQFDPKIVTALIKVAAQGAPAALASVDGAAARPPALRCRRRRNQPVGGHGLARRRLPRMA